MRGSDEWFHLCMDLNALGQQLTLPLELNPRDPRSNLILLLYGRVLGLFQDCLQHARRGRLSRARILVQGLLDSLMALAAALRDRQITRQFFAAGRVQHIFRSKKQRPLPGDLGQVITGLTGPGLARAAGLEAYYHALLACLPSPPVPRGTGVRALPGADQPYLIGLLKLACEGLLLASRLLADFFGSHNLDQEYQRLWDAYAALCRAP